MHTRRPLTTAAPASATTPGAGDPLAMLALYRARSAHYDEELSAFEPLREAAIERLRLQPGQTVLDVGCGTGLSFAPLLQRLGPQGHIVAIEQCPDMLDIARQRLTPEQQQQVTLLQASAESACWRGQADAALMHFTHDIVRQPAALANVFAHLAPGAQVVATGLQWAPPWAWAVNAFVLGAALYSVSSLDGLAQPWSALEPLLQDLVVTSEWMGSVYIASGNTPPAKTGPSATSARQRRTAQRSRSGPAAGAVPARSKLVM